MSLEGKVTAGAVLRGKIRKVDMIYIDAYAIAVKHGFEGTVEEWLIYLQGKDGYTPKLGVDYFTPADKAELVSSVISELPVYNGEVESV